MESGCFLQTVLYRIGYTAAYGTAGKDHADMRIVQNAKGSKESCGKGLYIGFLAVGKGIAAIVQGQLFFKAQNTITGFEMIVDICSGFFPA